MILKRGQKLCKECKQVNAARQRICKWCGTKFALTNKKMRGEITNWKDLQKGEVVRVINGTGPYYVFTRDCSEGNEGDRISLGAKGSYIVHEIDQDGIHCYGASHRNSGFTFVYMGKEEFRESTNIHRRPHRLVAKGSKRRK